MNGGLGGLPFVGKVNHDAVIQRQDTVRADAHFFTMFVELSKLMLVFGEPPRPQCAYHVTEILLREFHKVVSTDGMRL